MFWGSGDAANKGAGRGGNLKPSDQKKQNKIKTGRMLQWWLDPVHTYDIPS